MPILKGLNLALAFFLELAMLVAFGYWGFQTDSSTLVKIILGVGVPIIAIVIWSIYNAPKSARRLATIPRLILEVIMLTLSALALAVAGQPTWAAIFAVLIVINQILLYVWKQ